MADFAAVLRASKAASTLLVLFIPRRDRHDRAIDQEYGVNESLRVLGRLFGRATAFPRGQGVWREDAQGGTLLFDQPVVIQCDTSGAAIERETPGFREFRHRMGRDARQGGAIGPVIDRHDLEIGFSPEETPSPRPKGGKRGGQ